MKRPIIGAILVDHPVETLAMVEDEMMGEFMDNHRVDNR
jgi:hypothetical protein